VAVRLKVAAFKALHPDLFAASVASPKRGRAGSVAAKPKVATLDQLLVPRSIGNLTLQPEQQLSAELFAALCAEYRLGRLRCAFSCVCNELPIPAFTEQLRQMAGSIGIKRRAMGQIVGWPDWTFGWDGKILLAELKVPGGDKVMTKVQRVGGTKLHPVKRPPGRLSDEQRVVQEWCRQMNVPHAVWYSVSQGLQELRMVGALAPLP
jgi:hypothetical protein